jgi:hypothetical protein
MIVSSSNQILSHDGVIIDYSDPDSIKNQLTTSLAAYNSAPVNNWVPITSTEYANIAANVSGVTKIGHTDSQVTTRALSSGYNLVAYGTTNAATPLTIVTNQYLIAFVTETWNTTGTATIGYTTSYITGAPTSVSNSVTVSPLVQNYFVRKSPADVELAPATQTLYPTLACTANFNCVPNTYGYQSTNNGTSWTIIATSAVNGTGKLQMLVTSVKSW